MERLTVKSILGGMTIQVPRQEAVNRLAAYEDTMPLERAQELAQAEKAGQLVVLQGQTTVRELQEMYRQAKYQADEKLPFTSGDFNGFGAGRVYVLNKILTPKEIDEVLKKMEEEKKKMEEKSNGETDVWF